MSEEIKRDEELSTWREEWQALGGKEDLAASLVDRAAKDARKMKRSAAGEVLGVAFSTTICVALLLRARGESQVVAIATCILLFNGAWITQFFATRAGLFTPSAEGVEAFVTLTRRRLEAHRRWTRYARRWTAALALLTSVWAVWVLSTSWDAYAAAPWRAFVGFGTAGAIFAGTYLWAKRKDTHVAREQQAFEETLARAELA